MYSESNGQLDLHSKLLESLVPSDHTYRKLLKLVDFKSLSKVLKDCYSEKGRKSPYSLETALKILILQQAENHSDREMERFLNENNCAKYFCGFALLENTPDFTYFGKLRKRVGAERVSDIFNTVVQNLRNQNILSDCFTFIDASAVVSKANLWEARDKALSDKEKTLNNDNVHKYAADPDARFGAKSKSKYWFGYKRTQAVDMGTGLITKLDISPANQTDAQRGIFVLPEKGMVIADKGYDTDDFQKALLEKGLHSGVIKKNNRKSKIKELDKWLTKLRSPFEGLFFHADKSVRYFKGLSKVTFHQTLDALTQNLKTLLNLSKTRFQGIRVS
jgi:IS5 family transposase